MSPWDAVSSRKEGCTARKGAGLRPCARSGSAAALGPRVARPSVISALLCAQPQGERRPVVEVPGTLGPSSTTHHPESEGAGPRGDGALRKSARAPASAEGGDGVLRGLVTPAAPRSAARLRRSRQEETGSWGRRREGGRLGPRQPTRRRVCSSGCGLLSRAESQGPRCEAGVTLAARCVFHPCHDGL